MMGATAKASLTGIRGLRRSITKPPPGKPLNLVILFVAAVIREGRIYHEAVEIVEALTAGAVAGKAPPSEAGVIALSAEASEAVKRGSRAAGVVQAAGAVAPEAEDPAVAGLVAAEADGKNWMRMFNIIDSMEEKRCLLI
jgi:hypothetical protein